VYGNDQFRYFLMRDMVIGQDANFSEESVIKRLNSDLANDLGNLVNRTLSMINRYRGGAVPAAQGADLQGDAGTMVSTYRERMGRLDAHGALESLWGFITRGNRYVEESAPWKLAKDPAQAARLAAVLGNLAEAVRLIGVLIAPVMPNISVQIRVQLGLTAAPGRLDVEAQWGRLPAGTQLGVVGPLFPRKE